MAITPPLPCKRVANLECEWPYCKCYSADPTKNLVESYPTIETELKGCYRLIDELKEELRLAREEQIALLRFVEHPVTPEMWKALFPKEPR